ncbi:conserved Plasmodium protein, unknown function [Plasmodium vinckei vinckei]|uniref:Rab-GAP TBC domain-containing protein n=1 Tax=Plasmodium vinckei vinckei TaxID=54757 RepID=A0A449BWG7_PLAVN|nr:conserved Plasmodium protein, unknown function [Plasmodium vinckei vinckei]VEV57763.1 conserved Plasmodium protein, unknown function [Plasmodium vinckei vinckei]
MKPSVKKKRREIAYDSCVEFESLYKKKKNYKKKYSIYREKNYSDTEVYNKRRFKIKKIIGYIYIHKHYNTENDKPEKNLCLLDDVIVYKNYFHKSDEEDSEKLKIFKNILKIYENVTSSEKKKLYQIIKSFSYTQDGFQNNQIRQKIWLLLLGFNINLSKNREYNEHPINILCKKYRNTSIYNNLSNHFKFVWDKSLKSATSGDNSLEESQNINSNSISNFENSKNSIKNVNYDTHQNEQSEVLTSTFSKDKQTNAIRNGVENEVESASEIKRSVSYDFPSMCLRKRKKKCIFASNNMINAFSSDKKNKNENLNNIKKKRKKDPNEISDKRKRTNLFLNEKKYNRNSLYKYISPKIDTEVSCSHHLSNLDEYSSEEHQNKRFSEHSDYSNISMNSIENKSSTSSTLLSPTDYCYKNESGDMSNSLNKNDREKKCPLQFFSSPKSFDYECLMKKIRKRKGISNKYSKIIKLYFEKKLNKVKKKKIKCPFGNINKKTKRFIQKNSKQVVNLLLNFEERNKNDNYDKKSNKKFIIKLLKIIYGNILQVDIYIVDHIINKYKPSDIKNDTNINPTSMYLQNSIKYNYDLNSNLNKWLIDSVLLEENERVQVKKDVKRSVNTWDIHKNIIYEIKKKYQYILKNIICSILYKHSNKIYYAQGVHDVCLVFITVYFHKFFIKYQKYVFLEHFIYKYAINKICRNIFEKKYNQTKVPLHKQNDYMTQTNKNNTTVNFIHPFSACCQFNPPSEEYTHYQTGLDDPTSSNLYKVKKNKLINLHSENNGATNVNIGKRKKQKEDDEYDILQNNISDMFLVEEEFIEKICILNNIKIEKYIKYKKKKKKKEYIVYLLCERFLLFYMIDYLTLSLDVSIKNTFKGVGLLLRYLDPEVYNVFCILQNEQEYEIKKHNSHFNSNKNNNNQQKTLQNKNDEKDEDSNTKKKKNSLQLSGTEFFFCLSWVVTYYAHVFTEFDKLARLFDILLSNDGVFIIYFTSSIILHKKKELLEIVEKKKKYLLYNSMYTEIHYIFQNLNWKEINVENIINKTYYYMTHKIPFDKFLKDIKKKISFPPFSPIYSSPFILYYYNYQSKQKEKKNKKIQRSLINFYNYSHGEKSNKDLEKSSIETDESENSNTIDQTQSIDSNTNMNISDDTDDLKIAKMKSKSFNKKSSYEGKCPFEDKEKYQTGNEEKSNEIPKMNLKEDKNCDIINVNKQNEQIKNKRKGKYKNSKHHNKKGNVYLYYPYYILYKHIDIYKEIIKKHILVENFFQYIYYEFIINYKEICKKYDIYLTDQFYAMQYISNKNDDYIKEIKKKKKMEKIIYNMTKCITYLCADKYNQKERKKLKPIFFNFVKLDENFLLPYTNLLETEKNDDAEADIFDYFSRFNNSYFSYYINKYSKKYTGKNDKDDYIGIIPPIYKYIIEDSKIMKVWGHEGIKDFKDITHTNKKGNLRKSKKNLNHIYYILKTSIHNYTYSNFFFIFFLISVFSSFWYFRR